MYCILTVNKESIKRQGSLPACGLHPTFPRISSILTGTAVGTMLRIIISLLPLWHWVLTRLSQLWKSSRPVIWQSWDLNPASLVPACVLLSALCYTGSIPAGEHGNPLQYSCWRISWTEEPAGLQSIGLQRVRHDWSNLALRGEWVFKEPEIWEKFFKRNDLVEAMESVSERNKYLALTNIEWSTRWQYLKQYLKEKQLLQWNPGMSFTESTLQWV